MASLDNLPSFPLGLTYDDVLLIPQRSGITSRKMVDTSSKVSRHITLHIPIVASNMDTVCEDKTAVEMARQGGIGMLHRFCSIEEQCAMVRRVKRAQSFLIEDPRRIHPNATIADAIEAMNWGGRKGGVKCLMVTASPSSKRLVGVISASDIPFASQEDLVKDFMTPLERLVATTNQKISFDEASQLIRTSRTSNLPVLNEKGEIVYLITQADIIKRTTHKHATLDSQGRLVCGAAIGVKAEDMNRARALVKEGVDVLVVDIAHGHSDLCINMVKKLKADPITSKVDVIAGNIATAQGAEDLIAAGADGLKIGVGPGSICITRLVAGSGVPQLSAVMDCARVAKQHGVPIIADGGIKGAGDISKAIAAGAQVVMLGNMLAGTDEAPGRVLTKDGRKVKIIRGMAGFGANISKAERERRQDEDVFNDLVPEGVEGSVPVRGPLAPILHQLVGGLRSGMSYCGAKTIPEMQEKARFVRMSNAGLRESGSHDISKL
eukprot:gene6789-4871_t